MGHTRFASWLQFFCNTLATPSPRNPSATYNTLLEVATNTHGSNVTRVPYPCVVGAATTHISNQHIWCSQDMVRAAHPGTTIFIHTVPPVSNNVVRSPYLAHIIAAWPPFLCSLPTTRAKTTHVYTRPRRGRRLGNTFKRWHRRLVLINRIHPHIRRIRVFISVLNHSHRNTSCSFREMATSQIRTLMSGPYHIFNAPN